MSNGYSASAARSRILATMNPATSGLDAAAAMGTSGGCSSAPPTSNNPSTAAPGAYNGRPSPGSRRGPTATAGNPPTTAPSPSPSPSESPSPLLAVASSGDPGVAPGTTLATAPPSQPGPPALLAVPLLLLGTVIGYGAGWGVIKGMRPRVAQPSGDSSA
jgi:hypothetical protein